MNETKPGLQKHVQAQCTYNYGPTEL